MLFISSSLRISEDLWERDTIESSNSWAKWKELTLSQEARGSEVQVKWEEHPPWPQGTSLTRTKTLSLVASIKRRPRVTHYPKPTHLLNIRTFSLSRTLPLVRLKLSVRILTPRWYPETQTRALPGALPAMWWRTKGRTRSFRFKKISKGWRKSTLMLSEGKRTLVPCTGLKSLLGWSRARKIGLKNSSSKHPLANSKKVRRASTFSLRDLNAWLIQEAPNKGWSRNESKPSWTESSTNETFWDKRRALSYRLWGRTKSMSSINKS